MKALTLMIALMITSCEPLTEAQKDERAYERQEVAIQFEAMTKACNDAGGIIWGGVPKRYLDLRFVSCVSPEDARRALDRL